MATAHALERMPGLVQWCKDRQDPLLIHLSERLDQLDEMMQAIRNTLNDAPPLGLRDGGLLRPGVDEQVDELRKVTSEGKAWFTQLERRLREELSIPSLKVKINRQVGWYIEVTQTHADKVPEEWRG